MTVEMSNRSKRNALDGAATMTKYQVEIFTERDVSEQVAQNLANQEPEPTNQEWIAAGACWAAPPEWLYDTREEAEATVARLGEICTRIISV